VGVILLVIVAYVLVGATLSTAEIVVSAQKDQTLISEARLRTDLALNKSEISITGKGLNFSVTNIGNEVIADFTHIDIYTFDNGITEYQHYTYDKDTTHAAGTWALLSIENDYIHPNQIDPGEKAWIMAVFSGSNPVWVQVSTHNGVTAQTTFP
jgi:flagellar protein FlaF